MMRHDIAAIRPLLMALCAWLVLAAAFTPQAAGADQLDDLDAWAAAFPTALEVDLAAMILLPADYPVDGLMAGSGHLLRPIEEAAAYGPVLDMPQPDLLAQMRETGWVTRYVAEVAPAAADAPAAGWSSVTVFEDATGAAAGFALLDETRGAGVEAIPARPIGDASRLTRYTGTDSAGRPFDRLRYTFVSGALVGSVALFRGPDTPEAATTPQAVVAMAERLLARMQATSEAPGLPGLALRLNPTASLPIDRHNEVYYVVGGELIPHRGDSAEAIAGAEAFDARYQVEANYIVRTTFEEQQGVDHRPSWLVAIYRVGSADLAASMVRDHARLDLSLGYENLVELDALPAVDGPVAGSAYTARWADGSENAGYRITLAVGRDVAVVDVSAPGGVSQDIAFALVEAQAACLQMGMCAPLQAPFGPASALSTPVA